MHVFDVLKRSRNGDDADRNNFVITVQALVIVLGIVSRLFHSLSFVIICAFLLINVPSVI
jgi:hypothetical protein